MKLKKIMRTTAAVAALGMAVTLAGCSMKLPFTGKKPDFDASYTVCAQIQCGSLNAKADVTRAGKQDWRFEFTEPKQLCGVVMSYGQSGLSAELGELSFMADDNPQYAMLPEIISSSVDELSGLGSDNFASDNGTLTAELSFDGQRVTITLDEDTGNLVSLSCPHYQLAVNFSEQQPYSSGLPDEGGLIVSQ